MISTTHDSICTCSVRLSPSPSCGAAPSCCRPTPASPARSAPGDPPSRGPTSSRRAAASSAGPRRRCGSRPGGAGAPRAPASGPAPGLLTAPPHLPGLHLALWLESPPPTGHREETGLSVIFIFIFYNNKKTLYETCFILLFLSLLNYKQNPKQHGKWSPAFWRG